MQRGRGELAGGPSRLGHRGEAQTAPPAIRQRGVRRRWLPGVVAVVGLRRSRGTSLEHGSTTEPEFEHMRARGRRFSYDATLGVQMQVHLHRADELLWEPRATAPGETHRFKWTVAERHAGGSARCRRKR